RRRARNGIRFVEPLPFVPLNAERRGAGCLHEERERLARVDRASRRLLRDGDRRARAAAAGGGGGGGVAVRGAATVGAANPVVLRGGDRRRGERRRGRARNGVRSVRPDPVVPLIGGVGAGDGDRQRHALPARYGRARGLRGDDDRLAGRAAAVDGVGRVAIPL